MNNIIQAQKKENKLYFKLNKNKFKTAVLKAVNNLI
jgi:hypothetical protein